MTQLAVLARQAKPSDSFHVSWIDEANQFISPSFDPHYVSQVRSHRGAVVYIGQGLPGLESAFRGHNSKERLHSLVSNFGTRIVHALGDVESAHWCSSLLPETLETFIGGSSQPVCDIYEQLNGHGFSTSFSTQYRPVLPPSAFINGLRTGSKGVSDAIVIRSGEPFSNGENWLRVTFTRG